MKSLIRLFGFLIVLTTALSAATVRLGSGAKSMGQTVVKIRVIDADNGHPVQTQQVSVSMFFEKDEKAQPQDNVNLNLKTDANGEVQFELPQPAPAHLSAQVHLNQKKWRCGCMALVVTENLIRKGIVVPEPGRVPVQKTPKEIIFFAHHNTIIEKVLGPLVRD